MQCPVCGVDPDKTTSMSCLCARILVLCACGRYVVPGEAHEHISDAVDTRDAGRYFEDAVGTGG